MSNIYHYCSLDTFAQIIKNKTLRLSDLNKTNDYMEKKWGTQLLYNALCKELHANGISMNLKEDYWYSDEAHNHIEQLENDIEYFLNHQTLIACFSTERDLLSQWRGYGNDGSGVAIGFDYSLLKNLLKNDRKILIDKVIYKKDKQEKVIREKLFNPAFSYVKEMYKRDMVRCYDNYNEYFIDEFDCFCEVLDENAEKVFSFLKNPAFEEENEVRIVYNTGIYEEMEDKEFISYTGNTITIGRNKELELQPMQYAIKDGKLIAYTDLKFENCIAKGIIKEIIIGPKAKTRVSVKDICRFLLVNGIDTDILVSESSASYQ